MVERIFFGTLLIFLVLFFGKIALNSTEYSKYKERFKIECENKGGIMFVPKGVKGWPSPECRNPSTLINIDV